MKMGRKSSGEGEQWIVVQERRENEEDEYSDE
jgi:hypothetical protein